MIAFDLECSNGHLFEGWFNNIKSFEKQNAKQLVSCPYCDDTNIRKVISPVAMRTSSRPDEKRDVNSIDYRRLAKEMVDYLNKNFDDVGPNFTKEALKMHYGVTEKKNIKGSATVEEEKMLREEKIEFCKIPIPKIDDDKKH
jgi:hypothetical protein